VFDIVFEVSEVFHLGYDPDPSLIWKANSMVTSALAKELPLEHRLYPLHDLQKGRTALDILLSDADHTFLTVLSKCWSTWVQLGDQVEKLALEGLHGENHINSFQKVLANRMGTTHRRLEDVLHGRRIITLEAGYVGVGSLYARKGYVIVFIFGMSIPFILRREPRHYTLIGPVRVHVIMSEEVFDFLLNVGIFEETTFIMG
jgi:hypothetical protein